jgi:hypothetical protein
MDQPYCYFKFAHFKDSNAHDNVVKLQKGQQLRISGISFAEQTKLGINNNIPPIFTVEHG